MAEEVEGTWVVCFVLQKSSDENEWLMHVVSIMYASHGFREVAELYVQKRSHIK